MTASSSVLPQPRPLLQPQSQPQSQPQLPQPTRRPQALHGLAWLLALQSAGELLVRGLSLPVPGPVAGMLLLLFALRSRRVREPVALCADFLLAHLSLLFVPIGVGVMTHLPLLGRYGGRMMLVIVLSTWIGLAVTVLMLHLARKSGDTEMQETGDAEVR